ncbi:MAG: hypothetical protein F6J93_24795 [Oscillatoria sp. SIO1A7]|nr:hypothetical protein [Oscillatoria sp. SIO1A7]
MNARIFIALRIKVRTVQISLLASNGKACADRMTALLLIAYCYKFRAGAVP